MKDTNDLKVMRSTNIHKQSDVDGLGKQSLISVEKAKGLILDILIQEEIENIWLMLLFTLEKKKKKKKGQILTKHNQLNIHIITIFFNLLQIQKFFQNQ